MAKQVMLGVRLDAETRAAFKAWCAARQVTAQAVLRDDVARHLATPAVPPIPRDRRGGAGAKAEALAQAPVGAADGLDDRAQAPLASLGSPYFCPTDYSFRDSVASSSGPAA